MGKTKPYGVRFDTELIEGMTKKLNIKTPQRILNHLSDEWLAKNNVEVPVKATPKKKGFDSPVPHTGHNDEAPQFVKADKEKSEIDFGNNTMLIIENYTEYKMKDRPASGPARSEWDAKKKKADDVIREQWKKFRSK